MKNIAQIRLKIKELEDRLNRYIPCYGLYKDFKRGKDGILKSKTLECSGEKLCPECLHPPTDNRPSYQIKILKWVLDEKK